MGRGTRLGFMGRKVSTLGSTEMQNHVVEHWHITKPSVTSEHGMVASQHYMASNVGAEVLRRGGNAIDAAVAAGLALGTVEPWMSGLGGGGYMTVYLAREKAFRVVEFGMRAPFGAKASDYPLAGEGENAPDAFNWPAVVGDANVEGPLSIAVPAYLRGISLALSQWGTKSFADLIEPACQLAEQGLPVDWYTSSKINHFARNLRRFEHARSVFLPDGLPPAVDFEGALRYLPIGRLGDTYREIQREGAESFFEGRLAESIAKDLAAAGSKITLDDLRSVEARISEPLTTAYRDARIHVAGHLTAGPSLAQALSILEQKLAPAQEDPGVDAYRAYAESLMETYEWRLSHLGEGDGTTTPSNTSHLCAVDRDGNVVSLTQTIMSGFGSRILLPGSGLLMNNGMMWFDPRPGGANSVEGGRHPLCNMCPAIIEAADGSLTALGACGGRKIFPAVFQLTSFLVDYGMSIDSAVHQPRLDNSGTSMVTIMDSMPADIVAALNEEFADTRLRPYGVTPNHFALPQVVRRNIGGRIEGGCFIPSPHARVVAAD